MTTSTNTATNSNNSNNTSILDYDSISFEFISNECDEGIKSYRYKCHYENYYDDILSTNAVFYGSVLDKMEVLENLRKARDKIKEQEKEYNELENKYFDLQDEIGELRNSNTSNEEIRMLRQTIRRQMQTIASLQLRLNQQRTNTQE